MKNSNIVFTNITMGMQLGITIAVFVYGGYRLDLHYGKSPVFLSAGALLGMIIGFYHFFKELAALNKKISEKKETDKFTKWN